MEGRKAIWEGKCLLISALAEGRCQEGAFKRGASWCCQDSVLVIVAQPTRSQSFHIPPWQLTWMAAGSQIEPWPGPASARDKELGNPAADITCGQKDAAGFWN